MPLLEVNERPILGHGGWVTMYYAETFGFRVDVIGAEGLQINSFLTRDGSEAVEFFDHPFADPSTPDVFRRAPEIHADDEHVPDDPEQVTA